MRTDGQIDLHRLSQEQAHKALNHFLRTAQEAGWRCVLVITGKGYRSGSVGILKLAVPRWLNLPENRSRILAISHATPADGGDGALYVLLRRTRT
jgi:DNA-nicking Smr family endonuclease